MKKFSLVISCGDAAMVSIKKVEEKWRGKEEKKEEKKEGKKEKSKNLKITIKIKIMVEMEKKGETWILKFFFSN